MRQKQFNYQGWSVYCFKYAIARVTIVNGRRNIEVRYCAMATKRERGRVLMWNVDGASIADVEANARNRIDLN